jgi:hypothetical protein
MHFESGACTACRGVENARQAAYNLVMTQAGGKNFLSSPQLLTQYGNDAPSGYSASGTNYRCPACNKTFTLISSLLQHQKMSTQCQHGQHVNLRLGGPASSGPQTHRFFHGTTWDKAVQIQRNGFIPSDDGCLGRGVYVAREDKATKFAQLRATQTSNGFGGLVELLVTIQNPKYVISNDYVWQSQGYDACRAERTSASTNIEWCITDPRQIKVLNIKPIPV